MSDTAEKAALGAALLGPVVLGIVQGITEFLPVSSDGHLVLFQQFFDIGSDHILFDLVLHVGTLIPVVWIFRESLWTLVRDPLMGEGPFWERPGVRLAKLVVIASVPTALIGLGLEDFFEAMFATPAVLVVTFTLNGLVLFATRRYGAGTIGPEGVSWKQAVLIGVAQGTAIAPGISRSGMTISAAMAMGLEREFAARLSFVMCVPAILGAVVIKALKAEETGVPVTSFLVGGLVAMVVGYGALTLLLRVVQRGRFSVFAYWCWFAAVVAGVIAVWRATA